MHSSTLTQELYYESQHKRVKGIYKKDSHGIFGGGKKLADWYIQRLNLQKCACQYCKTYIHDIVRLINAGLLKTRKVGGGGVRGPVLEIDKQDEYDPVTCVLACYYCNNDKSYTSSAEHYEKYFGPNRSAYFKMLLSQLPPLP